ncbi:Hypothetical predicted protein, partial [Mytilus galloprovincialis]
MIYVLIYTLGLAISGAATTQFIYSYVKSHNSAHNSTGKLNRNHSEIGSRSCNVNGTSDDTIQAITSDWVWYITLAEYGIAIPFIIFVGPMVDRIGRKKILLWNLSVMTISFAMKAVAIYFDLNLYYFLVGFALQGFSGTYNTFHIASVSLLADGTSKGKERTIVIAIYDALLGFGIFFSYISTGYLIDFAAAAAGILKMLPIPLIKAILSRVVHPDKQGALFSNVYLIETVCQVCASTLFNNIYHQTVTFYKGFVFFVTAGFPLLALIMMV